MASNQTTFALLLLVPLALGAACDDGSEGQEPSATGSTSGAEEPTSGGSDVGETTAQPSTTTTDAGTTGNSDPTLPTATDAGESGDGETRGTETGSTDSGDTEGGETGDELPPVPRVRVATLDGDTFAFTEAYPLSEGPGDTDWSRWGVMHDGGLSRLYFLPEGGADEVYQFALNASSDAFEYGYESLDTIPVTGTPGGADTSLFGMAHDGNNYELYLLSGDQQTAYGFGFDGGPQVYAHGFGIAPSTPIEGAPAGIDWSGWGTASSGAATTLYAFASEAHDTLAQFELQGDAFTYVDADLTLDLEGLDGAPLNDFAVAHDGSATRLYLVEVD